MHGLPALHLNAAKYRCATHNHRLHRTIWTWNMTSFVDISTENSEPFNGDLPPFRNDDFAASEDCGSVDDRAVRFHFGAREINFEATKKSDQTPAFDNGAF